MMICPKKIVIILGFLLFTQNAFSWNSTYEYLEGFLSSRSMEKLTEAPNLETLDNPTNSIGQESPIVLLLQMGADHSVLSMCTAALIGPKHAFTAKHCLSNESLSYAIVVSDEGWENGRIKDGGFSRVSKVYENCPNSGWCKEAENSIRIPLKIKEYMEYDFVKDDIILIELENDRASKDGYFMLHDSSKAIPQDGLTIAGYPSKEPFVTKYITSPVCNYVGQDNDVLLSNCVPDSGISGGPFFYKEDGQYILIGIVSSYLQVKKGDKIYQGTRLSKAYGSSLIKVMDQNSN